jgi:hypothetical protein
MATAYGKRPSDFFMLETEIGAWVLDEACLVEGRRVENMLNEGKDPFDLTPGQPNPYPSQMGREYGKGGYAPAAKGNMKRVKIKVNGTW